MNDDGLDPIQILEQGARWEQALAESKKKLDSALIRGFLIATDVVNNKSLYAGRAFFAQLVLKPNYVPDGTIPTACTDGITVRYNPMFVNSLTHDELVAVLAHEALHPGFSHHARRGTRDLRKFNIAADLEINPILRDAGFKLPPGCLFPGEKPSPADLATMAQRAKDAGEEFKVDQQLIDDIAKLPKTESVAERFYDLLPDRKNKGGGQAGNDPGRCGGVDDAPGGSAGQAASKIDWQKTMAQAAAVASKRGTLPGSLSRFVEASLQPTVDWRDVLREFLVRSLADRDDYTWQRPNRRFISDNVYLPGLVGEALAEFVVHVDTSGSTAPYLEPFAGELNGVLELAPCKVTIVYGDAQVQRVEEWRPGDGPLQFRPDGGGGTNHTHVWQWLAESDVNPVAIICLTDMETDFGKDPGIPVLWAAPEQCKTKPPFGQVVSMNRS